MKSQIFRVFGFKYLREEAFQHIYSGKTKDKENLFKYKKCLEKAFLNPIQFNKLIIEF